MAATTITGAVGTATAPSINQVSIASTATAIVAADRYRQSLYLVNASDATIYIGGSDVTASNGLPIAAGGTLFLDSALGANGAWYGITASGSKTLGYLAA